MAEVVRLPSRLGETLALIHRLDWEIRALEARLEAARRHAAAEFASDRGWWLQPQPGHFGAIASDLLRITAGPRATDEVHLDFFVGRGCRPAAIAVHVRNPGSPKAQRIFEHARRAGLRLSMPTVSSWWIPDGGTLFLLTND